MDWILDREYIYVMINIRGGAVVAVGAREINLAI